MQISGARSEDHPLDIGVVQGSGLGPVMWNIFFAPIFDATQNVGIGFADDLNLMTEDITTLETIKHQVAAACKAARITMEPAKEVLTTIYPPRHPNRGEQNSTRLVGVQIDPDLSMKDHIDHVLSKARIAKTRLMRMKPYCTDHQLVSLYKTLIWSALENANVCYAHASEHHLRKLDAFQRSTLRMLGVNADILSLTTRRKTAHAAMLYKQTIMNIGPGTIRNLYPAAPADPRAHLRRTSTSVHPYQLKVERKTNDLKIYELFCGPFKTFNSIPTPVFPSQISIREFKRCVSIFFDPENQ